MKKALSAILLLVAAVGIAALVTTNPAEAAPRNCSNVRCAACPDGSHLKLTWPNCCQCVPD